jgi:hypothetical protein
MRSGLQAFAGVVAFILSGLAGAQLVVAPINGTTITPNSLAQSLLSAGSGITITNVTYTGANIASGTFSGGGGIIGIASGIVLTNGSVNNVVGPNNDSGASAENGLPGDPDLDVLAGVPTHDASVLTITFIPTGNTVQFSYVFGSEEYNEFINAFNDVFGFFVNGVNRALIQGTSTVVSVNNINCGVANPGTPPAGPGQNCNLFINNDPPVLNTQLDGLTRALSFTATVNPNVPNTLKIAIADAQDEALDSAVFIAAGSLGVCGGSGQPACGGGGTGNPGGPVAPVPTLGEWAMAALALGIAFLGFVQLRRRRG